MLERAPLKESSTLAALVHVRVHETIPVPDELPWHKPLGHVFVIDHSFGSEAVYKLASGHSRRGETALEAGRRELAEETNLRVPRHDFRHRGTWLETREHGTHWKHLFTADVDKDKLIWVERRARRKNSEQAKFFTTDEFYALVRDGKFMLEHYRKLVEFAAILPLGRDS